jgi:rubrerythrin
MTEKVENKLNGLVRRVRKVRQWLVMLAVLKVAALCLIFVSLFVGIYSWLDHHLRFGTAGRMTAFVLLAMGIVFLLSKLTRLLLGHISCSGAANYIESRRSFEQQLVTAVEFYEKRQDYPYSTALAEQLVVQVDKECSDFDFDATLDKWLGLVFSAVILFGLIVGGVYVHQMGAYFYSYFARLVQPLSAVAPLPATQLEAITKDVFAEPGQKVTLAAAIKGRVPQWGQVVILEGNDVTAAGQGTAAGDVFKLEPVPDKQENPKFEITKSFSDPGVYQYHFEAPEAASPSHTITVSSIPGIKSIKARVIPQNNRSMSYEQDVRDYTLEVPKDSSVMLMVEASEKLSKAVIKNLEGKSEPKELNGSAKFNYQFMVRQKGFIEFSLSSDGGVTNKNIPPLQVMIKPDEAPGFKLLSPKGDYLATDVASVPIEFEVTDDYGLQSVELHLEIAGEKPTVIEVPVEKGARSKVFSHTVELEQHKLSLGDSIVYYAGAKDVDTGSGQGNKGSCSDIYFIEVRPYRQLWHQGVQGLPGDPGKQGLKPPAGTPLEQLLNILEYTRAILKKTWLIASKAQRTDEDHKKLDSIRKDVEYCSEQLTRIRDAKYQGDPNARATLDEVLAYYAQAGQFLGAKDAVSAVPPEKDAYRVLRKFILELEMIMMQNGGSIPETPDKIKLEEEAHLQRYDKERIEWELQQLAQKLAQLAAEEKKLAKKFEHFLKQLEQGRTAQKTTDDRSWTSKEKPRQGKCPNCGSTTPGSCPACSGPTVSGSLPPAASGQNTGQGSGMGQGRSSGTAQGQNQTPGSGQGQGQANAASSAEQMKMFQAKQKALQQQIAELKASVGQLSELAKKENMDGYGKAEEHMDKADKKMDSFQERLSKARFDPQKEKAYLADAATELGSANNELSMAKEMLESRLNVAEKEKLAAKAEGLAQEMTELAEKLDDEAVKGPDRETMMARLEEAKKILELLKQRMDYDDGPKEQPTNEGQGGPGTANQGEGSPFGLQFSGPGSASNPRTAPAHAAIVLAQQFWSIAIRARQIDRQLMEHDGSDPMFYELESQFFESAAKYNGNSLTNSLTETRPNRKTGRR